MQNHEYISRREMNKALEQNIRYGLQFFECVQESIFHELQNCEAFYEGTAKLRIKLRLML